MKNEKKEIADFSSYDELIDFFDNPLIQGEIECEKNNTRKAIWRDLTKKFISELLDQNKDLDYLKISWDKEGEIAIDLTFKK